jgi:hypothetical protein
MHMGCGSFFCTKQGGGRIQGKSAGERDRRMKAKKNKRQGSEQCHFTHGLADMRKHGFAEKLQK